MMRVAAWMLNWVLSGVAVFPKILITGYNQEPHMINQLTHGGQPYSRKAIYEFTRLKIRSTTPKYTTKYDSINPVSCKVSCRYAHQP
ncbi:hypothetical protein I7I50_06137 [Histoplasma capsulatum G186AR]|uniref:Secreted protein n=1 Tax=Ajellomyces capsulatus TaxID=5037 RepID=A0A8H8D470_AJECA|nr:hypothetical protein I7I52_10785 [Histoplasma capsulatum]QSS67142.1 hypothetical protein I7I50_06137 [Histoplasma capsulatum G186AR]